MLVATIIEEQLGLRPPRRMSMSGVVKDHAAVAAAAAKAPVAISDPSIINPSKNNMAIVVSAMGGKPKVTDLLLNTVTVAAQRQNDQVEAYLNEIMVKHSSCLEQLFPPEEQQRLMTIIQRDMTDIRDILKTVALMKWQATRISELVSGYGEIWSAQILASLLQERQSNCEFCYLDARRVITVDEEAIQHGTICWEMSSEKLEQVYQEEREKRKSKYAHLAEEEEDWQLHFVITGYIATNTQGVATTLQRDGSDYSAAIMGRLLQSQHITIWTDVDGVLSADPRRVPSANVLQEVSYNEAMELAYFGAKVIHPKTMQPAISARPQIPIYIRNTFHSAFRGTRIYTSSTTHIDRDKCVCGFSSIEQMALINVEGSGLIGVPGAAKRLFGTLERIGVNVVLISQASSEHSITFATVEEQAQAAKEAIEEEFHKELAASRISNVDVQAPCSIIAAVGDGMSSTTGVSGRFFSALGDAQINVLAISQGCSERNISAVVKTEDSTRALRAVHAAFRLSHTTVRVGVVGMSTELGNSLLKLLESQRSKQRDVLEIDLQVCAAIAEGTSSKLVCLKHDSDGCVDSITTASYNQMTGGSMMLGAAASDIVWFDEVNSKQVVHVTHDGLDKFLDHLFRKECPHHVIFDCTGDAHVGQLHASWLRAGINVVTANNTGLSTSRDQRDEIIAAEHARGKLSAQYLCGVTVGGALPVVSTLRNLLNSGDKIRRVDGILSVSLSFILFRVSPPPDIARCSEFDEVSSKGAFRGDLSMSPMSKVGKPCSFSQAVKEAVALGLMEENMKSDLNNEYTARVLMVLARELGLDRNVTTEEIQETSEKIVDNVSADWDVDTIPPEVDRLIKDRVEAAAKRSCVIRHVSSVDVRERKIEIKIVEVPNNHIFAVTPPSCECVRFFTHRHRLYPLIIQGPSAGADSTASALLAELLHLMRGKVGARSGVLARTGSSAFLS
jgi:aspartokinase/homoserine dehydrogenase 1